jgi:hypothetical protein
MLVHLIDGILSLLKQAGIFFGLVNQFDQFLFTMFLVFFQLINAVPQTIVFIQNLDDSQVRFIPTA